MQFPKLKHCKELTTIGTVLLTSSSLFLTPPLSNFNFFYINQSTDGRYIPFENIEDLKMKIEDLRSAFGGFYFKNDGAKRHP
jgi:hypothetical protein